MSPMVPSSPSTDTPTMWQYFTTSAVFSMFSCSGRCEASIITEVKPQCTARMMLSMLSPWSMWITNGTELLPARATTYFMKSSLQ